jgi:hypothetical protein
MDQLTPVLQVVLIDRWTELEGTMATVAYPAKGMDLLADAATLRRDYGTVDIYTRKISGPTFTEENAKNITTQHSLGRSLFSISPDLGLLSFLAWPWFRL